MTRPLVDIMAISLTINWSVFCYSCVPKFRVGLAARRDPSSFKLLTKVCKQFADEPLLLSKLVTEQFLIWTLAILSLIAISAGDVIKFPFCPGDRENWHTYFVETIFAINIGRYVFTITENLMSNRHQRKVKFRADLFHHFITVLCYSLFLVYGENLLLGLVGILIETTTIFDDVGRIVKDHEKRHTVFYRRLVVVGCVFNVGFRGVIPTTFLIIAMFQQSPFTMNNLTLMVFFLSMIFFSVINVWQILSNIQRLIKFTIEKSHEMYQPSRVLGNNMVDKDVRHFEYSKNNLGYLRPYDNKNLAYQIDNEKHNLNNKKDIAKETIKLQLDPATYYSENKLNNNKGTNETPASSSMVSTDIDASYVTRDNDDDVTAQARSRAISIDNLHHHQCYPNPLRISNSSTSSSDSGGSDRLFVHSSCDFNVPNNREQKHTVVRDYSSISRNDYYDEDKSYR